MKRKIRERARRGSGEFIGFSISIIFLLYLFLLVLSFTIYEISSQKIQILKQKHILGRTKILKKSVQK